MTHLTLKGNTLAGRIYLSLPSMKNSRRLVTAGSLGFGRRTISIKSEGAQAFVQAMQDAYFAAIGDRTLDALRVPLEGRLTLTARMWYRNSRSDLDDALLCDALQTAGLIKDDNLIKEKHLYWDLDRFAPRVEFEVKAR